MKLHHKVPCKECPWRKDSLQGYLGGWGAERYADAVAQNEIPACHNRDHGPESDETAFCVGALQCGKNAAILPRRAAGDAIAAREVVGGNPDVFRHPADFYRYHTHGKEYVPYTIRQMQK